jgi:hypothetical protein
LLLNLNFNSKTKPNQCSGLIHTPTIGPTVGPIVGVLISGWTRIAAQAAMHRTPFDTLAINQARGFLISVNE